jgi:hypothetical protein
MLLPLPFAALVKLERNVALVLEVYLVGASVNVILRVWASCSKSGITTTNKSKVRNLPMRCGHEAAYRRRRYPCMMLGNQATTSNHKKKLALAVIITPSKWSA